MVAPVNVLVMIHGMVPDRRPASPFEAYETFYEELATVRWNLPELIGDNKIYVEWGHELENMPPDQLRDDQKLTRSQYFINDRVSYDAVRTDQSPNNVLLSGLFGQDYGIPGVRNLITLIRENIIHFGIGDVVYYCSPEGERQVRSVVYEQVLTQLDKFADEPFVRLHIVAQSVGVTLSHDFLYGLFAKHHDPDFVEDKQGSQKSVELFKKWRDKALSNKLQLGTLISTASQMPVFMMRKQHLVDKFFNQELLDPADIGIVDQKTVRWLIFYDIDDILGFSTRRLYHPTGAIKEIQVDSGDLPHRAHLDYWKNQTVIRETADLIYRNCQLPVEPTNVPT